MRILIVDDNADFCSVLREYLREGLDGAARMPTAADGPAPDALAVKTWQPQRQGVPAEGQGSFKWNFDALIVNGQPSGTATLEWIIRARKSAGAHWPAVLLLTGGPEGEATANAALKLGAAHCMPRLQLTPSRLYTALMTAVRERAGQGARPPAQAAVAAGADGKGADGKAAPAKGAPVAVSPVSQAQAAGAARPAVPANLAQAIESAPRASAGQRGATGAMADQPAASTSSPPTPGTAADSASTAKVVAVPGIAPAAIAAMLADEPAPAPTPKPADPESIAAVAAAVASAAAFAEAPTIVASTARPGASPAVLKASKRNAGGLPEIRGYTVERKIGEGGTAQVYLARREGDELQVVLKVLLPELASDAAVVSRFMQEFSLIQQIKSAHVTRIFDLNYDSGNAYLAMEYFGAGDLRDRIIAGGMPPVRSLKIFAQIARALGAIHDAGVVHRDLKPHNIMFRDEGHLAIVDFGGAKSLGETAGFTKVGHVIGTPNYMSPEQITGAKVDLRSDLYSLGVILHLLLTGQTLYMAASPTELMEMHLSAPIPHLPEELNGFQKLLNRLVAKDPDERFQSARELYAYIAY